jgi:hypothetical protein
MAETIISLPASPLNRVPWAEIKLIPRRIVNAAMTLLVIAYRASFVLILAERDIQSPVLNGASATLSLALFGMLARIMMGVLLGTVSGGAG